jgi:D-aspartate ligase
VDLSDRNNVVVQSGEEMDSGVSAFNGTPPVVVLGESLTGLGALRSLAEAGIPAFSVCPPGSLPTKSRWYRPLPEAQRSLPRPTQLADFLHNISLPQAVLLPCADDWTEAVAALPQSLKDRFPTSISSADVIATMVDKWRFAQMLDRLELPHPDTTLVNHLSELEAMPEGRFLNRFLKPLNSLQFNQRHGAKAFLIQSKADAMAVMSKGESAGVSDFPILLQEYIPGPPTNHYFVDGFVDRTGRICALFPRRRLRMFPPMLGNSTLMESIPLDDVLGATETLRKLLAVTAYRGIFSGEFKFDQRDRLFKLLEINARPWWFIEFATRAGVNLCALTYDDALGRSVQPIEKYRIGRRCMYLPNDLKLFSSSKRGVVETVRWMGSLIGAEESAFRWNDIRPVFPFIASGWRALFRD